MQDVYPTQPKDIVWDFYEEVTDVGHIIHYYNEDAQFLYLKNGNIETDVSTIPGGKWEGATYKRFPIFNTEFTDIQITHPGNDVVYMASIQSGYLQYIRYQYTFNIGDYLTSWDVSYQTDNPIVQLNMDLQFLTPRLVESDAALLNPGGPVIFRLGAGDEKMIDMGKYYIDETSYDKGSDSISISARNTIGQKLKDQYMLDWRFEKETLAEGVIDIFEHAGIIDYHVQDLKLPWPEDMNWSFDPDTDHVDAIQQISDVCMEFDASDEIQLAETPQGLVVWGTKSFIRGFLPNSYYTFNEEDEMFSKTISRNIDAAYTSVYVTADDVSIDEEIHCQLPVETWPFWKLGKHRCVFVKAPKPMIMEELEEFAAKQAEIHGFMGINISYKGPMRPDLLIGDIAETEQNGIGTVVGIVNSIKHSFSLDNGYITDFTIDSGGVSFIDGNNIYTRPTRHLYGANRMQRVGDVVRQITKTK